MITSDEAWRILDEAELLFDAQALDAAVRRVAVDLTAALADSYPLVLSVMGGAVVFTGQLLPLLRFPLDFQTIHVTRYGDRTQGGRIEWLVPPRDDVRDRTVLVLDDIQRAGAGEAKRAVGRHRAVEPQPLGPVQAAHEGGYQLAIARLQVVHGRAVD